MVLKLNPDSGLLDLVGATGAAGGTTDLTGDIGGQVSGGVADNIDLKGLSTQQYIQTIGTPGSNLMELKLIEPAVNGELLIGHTANAAPSVATLTAGAGISVVNGAGSITISATAVSELAATTDSGVATSVSHAMNVLGGTGVSTSGTGSTVTISASTAVPTSFVTDSGTATPASNILNVLGGSSISTSGSGSTLTVSLDTLTAGSVVFSNGSIITEDNSNFFWDDTNNKLGIGTNTPSDNLQVVGNVDVFHTSTENDDHALEIDCDAAGFSDVKALDIQYTTGAISAGENEEAILVNIDESASTGGEVFGIEILSTAEGSADIYGGKFGVNVNPILHSSGTFADADSILNKAVDVTAALADGGAGNISVFVADNDTVTIGSSATFAEIEVILGTAASGSGIAPTYEYSTGIGTWASFGPSDGTNGFRSTGIIDWDVADLSGFAVGTGSEYLIRITRTRNTLATTPIIDKIQIADVTKYSWLKDGEVKIKNIAATDNTAYAVLCGGTTNANPFQSIASVGTSGQVLQSQGAGALPVFATPAGIQTWTVVTTGTQALSIDNGYIGNNGTNITYTLPTTAPVGSTIKILNYGAGLPVIAQNASEYINFVDDVTTVGVGGSLTATQQYASIELINVVADTGWAVASVTGNWTIL